MTNSEAPAETIGDERAGRPYWVVPREILGGQAVAFATSPEDAVEEYIQSRHKRGEEILASDLVVAVFPLSAVINIDAEVELVPRVKASRL